MLASSGRGARALQPTWRLALLCTAAALLCANFLFGGRLLQQGYRHDADYTQIARGSAPPSYGLNLVCWSAALAPASDTSDFRQAYTAWREVALRELAGTGALIYPFDALHITIATPAPSLHAGHAAWSAEERALYTRAWTSALEARPCAPSRPTFPLVMRPALRLSPVGTVALQWDDPTGEVARMRECAREAAAALPPRLQGMLAAAGFKAPSAGFVHTTLLRLAEPRREGVTDADIDEAWGRAARAWERMVAQRIELVTARSAALVQGTELVNLAGPRPRDFVLWEREGSSKA